MRFLMCILLCGLVACAGGAVLKKYHNGFYAAAAVLSVLTAAGTAWGLSEKLPSVLETVLWNPLSKGSLATALFVLVMFAGAVPTGSVVQKKLMPIRAELSILASILTLGHNLAAGQEYVARLSTDAAALPANLKLAMLCSLVMLAIMLPLFVTSFPAIRKKMAPKTWKKLQRLAYVFYGLIYLHVLLIYVPMAAAGSRRAFSQLLCYSAVFLSYGALRIRKAMVQKQLRGTVVPMAAAAALFVLVLVVFRTPEQAPAVPQVEEQAEEVPVEQLAAPTDGRYQNGTFTGKGKGYAGKILVQVTIQDDVITDIVVTEHDEDQPYWDKSLVTIDRILEEQQPKVDTVAGATKSCKGIQKAVKDALKQAEQE